MIPDLDNLMELFQRMESNGFDTAAPLKWSFYFVDPGKEKLLKLYGELKESNYVLEKIYLVEEDDNEWTLHVSKVDILNSEKLHQRNIAFNQLAEYCEVALYDGWDVERI